MTSHQKKRNSTGDEAGATTADSTEVCVCPHCDKRIRFNIKYAGRIVKCPGCAAPIMLSPLREFRPVASVRRDRLSSIAGWTTSVVLHSLLLVSFTGLTWQSGFGTGGKGREVGIVVEDDSSIESGGAHLSSIQTTSSTLTATAISGSTESKPIENLRPKLATSGMEVTIDMGMQGGGMAAPVEGNWGNFAAGGGGVSGGGGTFFGTEAFGEKFVYVLDRSGSMSGDKLEAVKRELERSVHELDSGAKFFIIFYNHDFVPMMRPAALVRASKENKNKYLGWAEGIDSEGGTEPEEAMKTALSLKPDAIWLLSDGQFPERVCDVIRAANPGMRIQINTIAFYDESGKRVLWRIAEENRGKYHFVAPPASRQSYQSRRIRP